MSIFAFSSVSESGSLPNKVASPVLANCISFCMKSSMFAGVAEMVARAMVGFWFVPLWGYFAACIANPVAWFFACFFLIPAYFAVRKRLMKELAAARVED